MRTLLFWATLGLVSCEACVSPSPVVPGPQLDGGCAVLDEITQDREIRNPSDGLPLVIHCLDGGSP